MDMAALINLCVVVRTVRNKLYRMVRYSLTGSIALVFLIPQLLVVEVARAEDAVGAPTIRHAELIPDATLRGAVADYYLSEWKHDWAATYDYRRREFQDLVPFHVYEKIMKRGSVGVALREMKILRVTETSSDLVGASVEIEIRFFEWVTNQDRLEWECGTDPACRTGRTISDPTFNTVWIWRDNGWKCLECGRRITYSLNSRMVLSE